MTKPAATRAMTATATVTVTVELELRGVGGTAAVNTERIPWLMGWNASQRREMSRCNKRAPGFFWRETEFQKDTVVLSFRNQYFC